MRTSDLNQKAELTKTFNELTSLMSQYSNEWGEDQAQVRKRLLLAEKLVEGAMDKWLEVISKRLALYFMCLLVEDPKRNPEHSSGDS